MTKTNKRTKVLLMAAGLGTRLRPLTEHTPKCLVSIADKPLLDYWFDRFAAASLSDVLINTHHLPILVRNHISSINSGGWSGMPMRVLESFEPALLGSAGTIHQNRNWADDADDVLIVYADNLSNVSLEQILSFHATHQDPITMMLFRTDKPESCGIAEMDDEYMVTSFIEKPRRPTSNSANAGVYVVRSAAYREIADMNVFDVGSDVLPRFVNRMRGWDWPGYHRDIGTHESLAQAEKDVFSGCLDPGYCRSVIWSPSL